ncbi:MAG: peptidylprolyl isomerase [Candidatus Melainabacteria bacterium]|nr:peptidylprolyl isomerase [Candidatus Melainabacteria bacterium]
MEIYKASNLTVIHKIFFLVIAIYLSTTCVLAEDTSKTITKESLEGSKPKAEEKTEVKPVAEQKLKEETVVINSNTVLLNTDKGPIKINLFTKEAPITTNNFIDLVQKKFYTGTIFHRIVSDFVIQGGDPLGDGTGNYIDTETGEPRFIKLETNPNLKFDREGRVGMARTSTPNSASCQFFIALMALQSLDPGGVDPYGYAVFGQVSEDTFETVKKIVKDNRPKSPGSEAPANPIKINSAILLSN